uniref:Flap endonuclease n=1 Tax=Panulirus argus virus 1 TaxID=380624 RepID=A0A6G9HF22_9VIRU|nr:flap endonuclease [Panulirus argus virus 1]
MGLKAGVYSAMINDTYGRYVVGPDDVYKRARSGGDGGEDAARVYIDGTALLYMHLVTWKKHQDFIEEEQRREKGKGGGDAAAAAVALLDEKIASLAEHFHERLTSEIKNYAKRLEREVNHPTLYYSLAFDDRSRRPPNKEARKASVDVQSQVNSYTEYLQTATAEGNVFGNYNVALLEDNEDAVGYGYCGENDFRIVNAIDNDIDTKCHVIYSNDSDYFAFSYDPYKHVFFFSPGSDRVYDLSHLSTALVNTLVPVAAIGGCDYGTPTILGKDKSNLGKRLKELFATAPSYKNLVRFDGMLSDHLATIRRVGIDEFVAGGCGFRDDGGEGGAAAVRNCCEVDVLKRFVLYFDELYQYYIYLQPFTSSSEYFGWKICRRDAYVCILIYLHFKCSRNDPARMFAALNRLFKPRYVYHFRVSSLFVDDEEIDRTVCYAKERTTH